MGCGNTKALQIEKHLELQAALFEKEKKQFYQTQLALNIVQNEREKDLDMRLNQFLINVQEFKMEVGEFVQLRDAYMQFVDQATDPLFQFANLKKVYFDYKNKQTH